MEYKNLEINRDKRIKTINLTMNDELDNKEEPNEDTEKIELLSEEDIDEQFGIISNQNTSLEELLKSLITIERQSKFSEVSNCIHEKEYYTILFELLKDTEKMTNPLIILHFLNIMKSILYLPGEKFVQILLTDFQEIFKAIADEYFNGPPEIVDAFFETFLTIMRPPIDISFVDYYMNFFVIYLHFHNPCQEPLLTLKSFQCCNQMFNISHKGLQTKMLGNKVLYYCYVHMNRKTPSFYEACELLGNICYLNKYSIAHLEDDFFTDLIPDLLDNEDDKIVAATLKVLESLSSNYSVCEILINNGLIFEQILNVYDRGFEVKKCSIDLITTLIECESIRLEINFIEYGTLDFFVEYLFTEEDNIRKKVLAALTILICRFVDNLEGKLERPPFLSVLANSTSLLDALKELTHEDDLDDELDEASVLALGLLKKNLKLLENLDI